MHSIRRSCQSAVRNSHGAAVYANGSRRTFSRSAAWSKGGLPVFLKSSDSRLSSLLSKINSQVLLPQHLTREQQKLVFQEAGIAKLETEPVEVTIGDVTLPLEHLDRNRLPSRWKSLKEVIQRSKSPEDWENVVRVLEGYHSAGITIQSQWQEKVVRKLNENGHHSIVLKALQRVKATGLRLSNYPVAVNVLSAAHVRATDADWGMEETAKSMRYATQVVELMEESRHRAVSSMKGGATRQTDPRSAPFVIAVPTELAAVLAQKHEGDVEVVKKLANRLVNALKQGTPQDELDRLTSLAKQKSSDFESIGPQLGSLTVYCQGLFESLIIWNALKTSKAVLGANMPLAAEAAEFESRIKDVLDESIEAVPKLQTRGSVQLESRFPAYLKEQIEKCQG